jgi:hypothetical protein
MERRRVAVLHGRRDIATDVCEKKTVEISELVKTPAAGC